MTIVDIYNSINNKEAKTEKVSRCWRPIEAKDYGEMPKFTVPQKRKQKSTDKMLASTLLFVDLVKHKRLCDKVTRMPISTNNKVYLKAFGNSMAISRLINFMTAIGLITIANSKFRFNSTNSHLNKSREYYYYHVNECALIEYCETHNISVSPKSRGSASLFNRLEIGDLDSEKVKFSSKLKLKKLDDYSKTEFEELLKFYLYFNYPHLN